MPFTHSNFQTNCTLEKDLKYCTHTKTRNTIHSVTVIQYLCQYIIVQETVNSYIVEHIYYAMEQKTINYDVSFVW